MVKRPEEYKWSSYGVNAWGDNSWLFPHDENHMFGYSHSINTLNVISHLIFGIESQISDLFLTSNVFRC